MTSANGMPGPAGLGSVRNNDSAAAWAQLVGKAGEPAWASAGARRLGSLVAALSIVPATAVALIGMAGGSRAIAATRLPATPAAVATAVTWHKLTLLNNWRSDQKFFSSGDPAWASHDGVVYLRGAMDQFPRGFSASNKFAVLPKAARPARKLFLIVYADGVYGDLVIYPTGVMDVSSSPAPLEAKSFTSLDGISFPASPTIGHKLTLLNGWKSGQQSGTGTPAIWRKNGVVYLLGSLHALSGFSNRKFAVLPSGARPARALYINTYGSGGTLHSIAIGTNGAMTVLSSQGDNFTSLAAISFPAGPVIGHKLTLLNGWVSSQGQRHTGDPAYRVSNGIVYLLGSLRQPKGTNTQFAVLPPAARPAHFLWIPTYANKGMFGWVEITPSGLIYAVSASGNTAARLYTSLAAISYPAST